MTPEPIKTRAGSTRTLFLYPKYPFSLQKRNRRRQGPRRIPKDFNAPSFSSYTSKPKITGITSDILVATDATDTPFFGR